MKLISFSLQNYRRFVQRTTIKLHGPMVAIVGPNEAGKSSLLRALARLGSSEPFDRTESPRRSASEPTLEWHFALDESDVALLDSIPEASAVKTVTLTKSGSSNTPIWSFGPTPPARDLAARHSLLRLMDQHSDAVGPFRNEREEEAVDALREELQEAGSFLEGKGPNLSDEERGVLDTLLESVRRAAAELAEPTGTEDALEAPPVLSELIDAIGAALAKERETPPEVLARRALQPQVPSIQVFQQEDRDLESSYELTEHAESPPAALMHLASLAELDLRELLREAQEGAIADVGTRRNAANRVLLERFDQAWNQQGIAIQFDVQGTILHVQATTPEDSGLSSITERSDGLRWFAALLAWSHGWAEKPIVLADEIETHLHYDAQSDLIDVLAQQEFASKVVFTTHSFGCLPHDLGTGVRAVEQIDAATSRVENAFWQKGAGFSPLLASMGAAATSLTPTRHALLAEGPSDAILLPTLLRQAGDLRALRFQVAPGLASVAAVAVSSLDAEAGRVCFVVDGDQAGEDIRAMLVAGGVEDHRVIVLADQDTGDPIELEDLIDLQTYLAVVNAEILRWQSDAPQLNSSDLTATMRTKAVATWAAGHGFTGPDKTAVAQAVVDLSVDRPVFDTSRQTTLRWILQRSWSALSLAPN
ncbi:AAA family ATPase [Nocardioides currus]|uniref:AAA+ ATPase domain-containing protein n=1 Tax=Nocardioides currus TaxID=2133958 RepID=A0A2R7YR70_9ACTN|nr:AAA family ATPase [Nocardioides currus]PUA78927.1 hypothetical protein C7S10_21880 [Nocardioides currus]